MKYSLDQLINILERTPAILRQYFKNLDKEWLHKTEGGDSWSLYHILGHLIYGEKTDWMVSHFTNITCYFSSASGISRSMESLFRNIKKVVYIQIERLIENIKILYLRM